jgi:hypothetical protein
LRVRERFDREARALRTYYSAILWAMERNLKEKNEAVAERVEALRADIRRECGALSSWWTSLALGPLMLYTLRREARRLAEGITYEPETFIDRRNWADSKA